MPPGPDVVSRGRALPACHAVAAARLRIAGRLCSLRDSLLQIRLPPRTRGLQVDVALAQGNRLVAIAGYHNEKHRK